MNIKDIVAVSGVPGLSRLVANRTNGLVLEDLDTGKSKFYSVRKHQFTPLETVAIYTMMDTVELKEVFTRMITQRGDLPIVSPKAKTPEIIGYFEAIIPDYDRDRVFVSDMKKIIKWFNLLEEKGMLNAGEEEE